MWPVTTTGKRRQYGSVQVRRNYVRGKLRNQDAKWAISRPRE
jgi:hypothetical protein